MSVVQFQKRDQTAVKTEDCTAPVDYEWACNCGNKEFALYQGGEILCMKCGTVQSLRHFDPRDKP